ncbi:MAG TPA: hypothetical protein ENK18_05440 [Deltaproteobacteria bacterium]|nr:hypothetical protein [Deltaproteobacteria bacterium]
MTHNVNIDLIRPAEVTRLPGMSKEIPGIIQDDPDAVAAVCDALATKRDAHPDGEVVVYTFHDGTKIPVWNELDSEAH